MNDMSHELWIEHQHRMAVISTQLQIADEQLRPFFLYKPSFQGLDGNMYWFLFGLNLMEGVAGFGETMELATRDFDQNWINSRVQSK